MAAQIFFGAVGAAAVLYGPSFVANHSLYDLKFTGIGIASATACGFCTAVLFAAGFAKGQKKSIFKDKEFYNIWFMFSSMFCVVTLPVGLALDGTIAALHT